MKEDVVNGFLFEAEFFSSLNTTSDFIVNSSSVTCSLTFTVSLVDKLIPGLAQLLVEILYELCAHVIHH